MPVRLGLAIDFGAEATGELLAGVIENATQFRGIGAVGAVDNSQLEFTGFQKSI